MENQNLVIILSLLALVAIALVGIWNNCLGHNPYMIYRSRSPFCKFYGYPLWNLIAFLSFGKLKKKSWREEFNKKLCRDKMERYIC